MRTRAFYGEKGLRVDIGLHKPRKLIIVLLSLTLIMGITTLAPAYVDYVSTYNDPSYSTPDITFDDGATVYVTATDQNTSGGTKPIWVKNDQDGNTISVIVDDSDADKIYKGFFIIHSGVDAAGYLHMEHGQTATITANLDGDEYQGTATITANYVGALLDIIWTYSDPNRTVEATEFGDGDSVYFKVSDSQTRGGIKTITVENDQIGNSISVQVPDSQVDGFYLGNFKVYSQGNDDPNDRLTLFDGQSATITADLASDALVGIKQIFAAFSAPPPTSLTATALAGGNIQLDWIPSSPEGNVASYRVFRAIVSKEQDFASPIATVPAGTSTYTDAATTDGLTYYYVVRAVSKTGTMESNTNEAIATADATPPPSPSNLTVAPISGDGVQVTWTASSPETDVLQYNIYRAIISGAHDFSSPTYTVSVGITSYTDSSATVGQAYYYVVRAQDAAGNTDSNTNEAWTTAGFAFSVDRVYTRYQEALLCNLISSTDRQNPTAFTKGRIDEIYFEVNLLSSASLNESSSSIALYKLVDSQTEEVLGSKEVNQGTGWVKLMLHFDSEFDPDVDEHSQDGLYWVDIRVVDTAANSQDYDFYFIYDTISPSVPSFEVTSYDPTTGLVTISGTTVPDELSDPQTVEIFLNGASQGTVHALSNYQFIKTNIPLVSGTNSVEVQSTDRAGNKSEISESLSIDWNPGGLTVFRSVHVVKSDSSIDIIYSVAQPAQITIQVFNLLGEIVKEWQGSVSANTENQWTWYGRNMYEQEVNNGVYICKINAQGSNGTSEQKIKLLAVAR